METNNEEVTFADIDTDGFYNLGICMDANFVRVSRVDGSNIGDDENRRLGEFLTNSLYKFLEKYRFSLGDVRIEEFVRKRNSYYICDSKDAMNILRHAVLEKEKQMKKLHGENSISFSGDKYRIVAYNPLFVLAKKDDSARFVMQRSDHKRFTDTDFEIAQEFYGYFCEKAIRQADLNAADLKISIKVQAPYKTAEIEEAGDNLANFWKNYKVSDVKKEKVKLSSLKI